MNDDLPIRKLGCCSAGNSKPYVPFGAKVAQWAEDRNLIKGSEPLMQMAKLREEVQELDDALCDDDRAEIIDAIGDIQVVLGVICAQLDYDIDMCREAAWLTIKDRKGRMMNGVFVKEAALEPDPEPIANDTGDSL